jgi:hypothetical protein
VVVKNLKSVVDYTSQSRRFSVLGTPLILFWLKDKSIPTNEKN